MGTMFGGLGSAPCHSASSQARALKGLRLRVLDFEDFADLCLCEEHHSL